MVNVLRILVVLMSLLLFAPSVQAEWCHTVMVPESDGTGGAITIPTGVTYNLAGYAYPPGASKVGLEFWMHSFDVGAPPNTLYLLTYLNRPDKPARRLFHNSNAGPESGTGWTVSFPLSVWMHPDEYLAIVSVNNSGVVRSGYLIVTIRECYP